MTAQLSIAAKGVWIATRMLLTSRKQYAFDGPPEALGWLINCSGDILLTSLKEFELKDCGFRVEWPPCNAECNGSMVTGRVMRLVWVADEKLDLFSSLNSFRVSKHRESKKISERKRMPEDWKLSQKNMNYALAKGMTNATVMHEFEKCRRHHEIEESLWTDKGWEHLVWERWVLNWIGYGRKQVQEDVWQ